ncbi:MULTISPECIES: hypothetical protein [unclassified Streptomyces]|uniref:hypothetical protein n=1 Tax=unclassified Streptomyces TaxID=2593676 RepID=UPI0020338EF0|nr:hypothetical protein [Streptomyces sp. RKAG290]
MDTQLTTEAIKSGTLQKIVQSMSERLKPEAVYFHTADGRRCCTFVFDMQDSSELPGIAEPLFDGLGAELEFQPVMNLDDLRKGFAAQQQG